MAYTPFVWHDDPTGGTPITAARLNAIESAIAAAAAVADGATTSASTLAATVASTNSTLATTNSNVATNTAGIASNVTAINANTSTLTTLVSRVADQHFNVMAFGAKGDGSSNDTAAVQNAINAALDASTPNDFLSPKYNNKPATVFFPKGTYVVDQVNIPGSLSLRGAGGYGYAAATLQQRTSGQAILQLQADTDGTSQATTIDSLAFRSVSGTSDTNAAQIRTDTGIGSNSVYIRRCWFFTPERYALAFEQGDDIKIIDCTFDVAPFHAIKIGGAGTCSNMQISDNTFFDIALRALDIRSVAGLIVTGNKFYKGSQTQPSVGIETADSSYVKGVTVTGNHFASIKRPLHVMSAVRAMTVTGNDITGNFDSALVVDGTGILQNFVMTGNAIYNENAMDGGSCFRAQTTALQACVISMNSIIVQNATALVFNMPVANTSNNYMRNNPNINFSAYDNFPSGTNNG